MVRVLERLGTFPNVGKPANVVLVDSPQAVVDFKDRYPTERPIFVDARGNDLFGALGQLSAYWWYNYGKSGPVVIVETPQAEAAVRALYPSGSTMFVRPDQLPGLGETTPIFKPITWPVSLMTIGLGSLMAVFGFMNRTKPFGNMIMGAGASMIGTSGVLLIRDLMD